MRIKTFVGENRRRGLDSVDGLALSRPALSRKRVQAGPGRSRYQWWARERLGSSSMAPPEFGVLLLPHQNEPQKLAKARELCASRSSDRVPLPCGPPPEARGNASCGSMALYSAKQIVGVSQSDIRCGISGIMHDRLGKESTALLRSFRSTFLEVIAALQVEILSFDAGHVRSGKSILEARLAVTERESQERADDQRQWYKP